MEDKHSKRKHPILFYIGLNRTTNPFGGLRIRSCIIQISGHTFSGLDVNIYYMHMLHCMMKPRPDLESANQAGCFGV